jgi:4-hydroxybenzoate polyprenyltransferase
MKMKTYYFIITLFAITGIALLFSNYPIVIAIASFGIGIGYKEYTQEEKEYTQEEKDSGPEDTIE